MPPHICRQLIDSGQEGGTTVGSCRTTGHESGGPGDEKAPVGVPAGKQPIAEAEGDQGEHDRETQVHMDIDASDLPDTKAECAACTVR